MILGLPGILFIVLGYSSIYPSRIGLRYTRSRRNIGAFLVLRGFKVDKTVQNFIKWIKEYSPPPFTVQVAGFSALAGVLRFFLAAIWEAPQLQMWLMRRWTPLRRFRALSESFFMGQHTFIALGICVILSGRAVRWFLSGTYVCGVNHHNSWGRMVFSYVC